MSTLHVDSPPRILVVEDNPISLKLTLMQLKSLGYQSDSAVNGQEALKKVAEVDYAVILMDCQMPVLDGFAATREIRRQERARNVVTPVRIVALTANSLDEAQGLCLAAGMNDYATKPVLKEKLATILKKWL